MARTRGETLREVTRNYMSNLNPQTIPSQDDLVADILQAANDAIDAENAIRPKNKQWKSVDKLIPAQIADILSALYTFISVAYAGEDTDHNYDLLCIYQEDGENAGLYVFDERYIEKLARNFNYELSKHEAQEVLHILRQDSPRRTRCSERNLIAVKNGIFDYDTKQLLPFTPDKVFVTKSHVDYNPQAYNVVIHNDDDGTDWDVESWMEELFDDPELVQLMWEIIGAIVRPNVPWNKSAWFYSESGNNGKGTLCELMRQICGAKTYTSIPLSDFKKDFLLEPLVKASSIIVDENDVGTYIDKAANLKAVITGDVIQINRKFKTPIAFQFKGFMVQCLNELPRIKDKSDSFYRRQLFVPFTKCFTGAERKYIKNKYLHRQDVLEYVLYKVLMMNYYELSTPKACVKALDEYKEYNDPVRQFMSDIMPALVWDLVPYTFLYELYSAYYDKNYSKSDGKLSKPTFKREFLSHLDDYPGWKKAVMSNGEDLGVRPSEKMDRPEPLIEEYKLVDWMNPQYRDSYDINKRCLPNLKSEKYKGIVRV